ncbi:sulfotransferase domain-containing protein [Opitutales bacterium]|nr:sulfotransferase domain-containing protein [Opitutales bacterium]
MRETLKSAFILYNLFIMTLPNFIIIGAQKSASSFMQVCLSDHPDVFMPIGETAFFETPDYEQGSISDLEDLFTGKKQQCLGIKRPVYIGRSEVADRIKIHLPDAKIIAVLRNPIDRAMSSYFHNVNYGFLPPIDIEEGMRAIISDQGFRDSYPRSGEVLEAGFYWKYLKEYNSYKEAGNLLVFLHEDILNDPLQAIRETFRFLGVDDTYVPSTLESKPQSVTYNLARLKVRRLRNPVLFRYSDDRMRLYKKDETILGRCYCRSIDILDKLVLSKFFKSRKPNLSLELRKLLYSVYEEDINILEESLSRDLTEWKVR